MKQRPLLKAGLATALLLGAAQAQATQIMFELTDFTGTDAALDITLDDVATPNAITLIATVDSSTTGNIADIRGIFFNLINDPGLALAGITGTDVTDKGTNTSNTGGGNNVNPAPSFDFAIEIGTSGIGGGDDFQTTTIFIDDVGGLLDLSDFGLFAGRLTSVGPAGGSRGGSSKLTGTPGPITPPTGIIPAPATLFLFGTGLLLLGLLRYRRIRS